MSQTQYGVDVQYPVLFSSPTIIADRLAIIVQCVTCLFEVMHHMKEGVGDFVSVLGRM
jgi:hypothetical protein